jgi:hypothetical protein
MVEETIVQLLRMGANPHANDGSCNRTPLGLAAAKGKITALKTLLACDKYSASDLTFALTRASFSSQV